MRRQRVARKQNIDVTGADDFFQVRPGARVDDGRAANKENFPPALFQIAHVPRDVADHQMLGLLARHRAAHEAKRVL